MLNNEAEPIDNDQDDNEALLETVSEGWRAFVADQPAAARMVATLLAAQAADLDVEISGEPQRVIVRLAYRDGRGSIELFRSQPALNS